MYSPFDKSLDELTLTDIQQLVDEKNPENWFIEYKSRIPISNGALDAVKIAKSVSSFANTKGGWIFWGIECTGNEPTALPGIDISGYVRFHDDISRIISSNVNPNPVFHFKDIPLTRGNIIFVIHVEESPTPPYITNQGIIYQRENNESKPIKDRYIIEKMNEKAEQYIASIEHFSEFDLGETKGESDGNASHLELYLFPKPFDYHLFKDFHKTSFFDSVCGCFFGGNSFSFDLGEEKKEISITLGFNSIYATNDSIIVRAINDKNLIYKTTTVELFNNGNLKVTLPLFDFSAASAPDYYGDSKLLRYLLDKYCPEKEVSQVMPGFGNSLPYHLPPRRQRPETDFSSHIRLIDGGNLVLSIMAVVTIYEKILLDNGFEKDVALGMRARISNVWRKFVFFDGEDYLEKIKRYNFPLIPRNDLEIPTFKNAKNYEFHFNEGNLAFLISTFIINGLGLPDPGSISYVELIKSAVARFEGTKRT